MKIEKYLSQSPLFAINTAYEKIVTQVNKHLRKENLNLLQGLVLAALFFEDEKKLTPSSLAQSFETSRGNMSHIISHLEYKGFVKRVLSPEDARQFYIELKPAGRAKALLLIKYFDKVQDVFEKQIGTKNCLHLVQGIRQLRLDL